MKCLKVTSQNYSYQISGTTDSQKCHFLLVVAYKLIYNENEQSLSRILRI